LGSRDKEGNLKPEIEKNFSISWTVVEDGKYVYALVEPASLHKSNLPDGLNVVFLEKTGNNSPE
jgi:hypothetical protein